MNLAQIQEMLPNGFHDAEIAQLMWNFMTGSVSLDMDFWVACEEDRDRERRRRGKIELRRISFLAIEPPVPRASDPNPYSFASGTLQIDGVITSAEIFPTLPRLKPQLPEDTEVFSFYVVNWNSFIHIAAADAKLIWADG